MTARHRDASGSHDHRDSNTGSENGFSADTKPGKPVLWPLLVLLILIYMANILYILPLNRVLEMRLCRDYYLRNDPSSVDPDGPIPEKLCKIYPVWNQLAWIQGIMETTMFTCDFVVTIPFSFLTQKYGIKVVLWLNVIPRISMMLWTLIVGYFDQVIAVKAIIAGPFLNLLGGECVFSSTIFALTAALSREYVQSASNFAYISSAAYVISFFGPSAAAFAMSQNIWLPFWIGLTLLLVAMLTIKMIPEPRHNPTLPTDGFDEEGPLLTPRPSSSSGRHSTALEPARGIVRDTLHAINKLFHLVIGRRNFQVLLGSILLTAVASSDSRLLVQYISKRYERTFAQAGYLLSAKALVNICLLTIIVPRLIRAAMSSSRIMYDAENKINYLGAQLSIAFSIVGVLCIAMSFEIWMLLISLVLYAVGSALPVFTMSLVKSSLVALPESQAHTQDFSIVMLTKTLGSLIGAPLMTVLWVRGMDNGGTAIGLPYLISACLYLVAGLVIAQLRF